VMMTAVKTELMDTDEAAATAAAAAADEKSNDNSDKSDIGQQSRNLNTTSSAGDVTVQDAAAATEYNIKTEKKTEEILDLSRIADDDDVDDSADGIRYLSWYPGNSCPIPTRTKSTPPVVDPEIVGGGRCGRAAEGHTRVWGVWRSLEEGSGEGLCRLTRIFFLHFGPQNGQFQCIVGAGVGCIPHPPVSIRH